MDYKIDLSLTDIIPVEFALKYKIFPLAYKHGPIKVSGSKMTVRTYVLAMAVPAQFGLINDQKYQHIMNYLKDYTIELVCVRESEILAAIYKYYPTALELSNETIPPLTRAEELTSTKQILLADCDPNSIRIVVEDLLETYSSKIEIFSFTDGYEAADYLTNNIDSLNLIISGVHLHPGSIDDKKQIGIALLRMCKERRPRLPFIFRSSMDYKKDFTTWAADAYIMKSADTRELRDTVHTMLMRSEEKREK